MEWSRSPTRVSKSRRRPEANPVRVPKVEAQNISSSSPVRSPGAVRTKNDAQVAYGVRFGRSLHGWKDNFKELPMELVWVPNSLGVDGNIWNKWTSRVCQFAATPSFGLLARVSCWGTWWTWLGGYACPNPHIISSCHHIRVWVLFRSDFPSRNCLLHCNCDDKSFCYESGPRSWSPPLYRLFLWNWVLEPLLYLCFIRTCNFRLRVYTFLLVFFDSLAGKAFLAKSIKLFLVDN